MKYYLHNGHNLIAALTPTQLGSLIREFRRDGYSGAALTFERMRTGALSRKPYHCNQLEIQNVRIARGATDLTKALLGDVIGGGRKLTIERHFTPPEAKFNRVPHGHSQCPSCGHVYDAS